MTMARLLVVLFALTVVGVAGLLGSLLLGDSTPRLGAALLQLVDPLAPAAREDTSRQLFTVPAGASAAEIGEELQRRGLVRSGLAFRLAVEQEGVSDSLAAGDYELSRSMSTQEIVQVLARGQTKRGLSATLPEGWRAEQIADRLETAGLTSRDEFLRAVADPRSVPGVDALGDPPPPTLEGYLFPETYEVRERQPGTRVAELMVRMFDRRLGDLLRGGSSELQLSRRQILTLASIVEREARQPSERATIASVYLNRLAREMPLQADPTVQYAAASRDGAAASGYDYWKPLLTPGDLEIDSPFNTYTHPGLPPGPICNPGEAAVRAVVQPARTDFLYFVAKNDGSSGHLFARTLEEHNANVARVAGH